MSLYPQEYTESQYYYSPAQYQAMQWQAALEVLIGVAVLAAMGAWAFSLVKKAFRGEEVPFPL